MIEGDFGVWNQLGAIGSAVSGLAALFALFFVGLQIREARHNADAVAIVEFWRDITDRETALAAAERTEPKFSAELLDLINFLEIQAALLNAKRLHSVTKKIVKDKVLSALAIIENEPTTKALFEKAIESPSTFEELRRLKSANRRELQLIMERMSSK